MAELVIGLFSFLGGSGAAAGGTAGAGAAAGTAAAGAGVGSTIASILGGGATLLSVFSGIGAANAEADALEAQSVDAETEQSIGMVRGAAERAQLRRAMIEAVGAQDVAFAASGQDLSFGTPAEARRDAFREADLALSTSSNADLGRFARLDERRNNARAQARKVRGLGALNAIGGSLSAASRLFS